jgi:hypothetical protein
VYVGLYVCRFALITHVFTLHKSLHMTTLTTSVAGCGVSDGDGVASAVVVNINQTSFILHNHFIDNISTQKQVWRALRPRLRRCGVKRRHTAFQGSCLSTKWTAMVCCAIRFLFLCGFFSHVLRFTVSFFFPSFPTCLIPNRFESTTTRELLTGASVSRTVTAVEQRLSGSLSIYFIVNH